MCDFCRVVLLVSASLTLGADNAVENVGGMKRTIQMPVPLIHTADFYHPPCDPDDHWDLASLFALAKMGYIELLGVVIDHPLPADENGIVPMGAGEPAVQAIAQLNYITGKTVTPISGNGKTPQDFQGAKFILQTLRSACRPVAISIAGSCRDVAIAGKMDPVVFQRKCAGIYLNAGAVFSSVPDLKHKEWNVALDPWAYRALFDLPCPVYWLPCFDDLAKFESQVHGSFWRFRQGDILNYLSPPVQNYFLYALTRSTDQRWMSQITGSVNTKALEIQGSAYRNMWCTAGFLHLAGLTVTRNGDLASRTDFADSDTLFHFRPIRVELDQSDVSRWEFVDESENRFLFEVSDVAQYKARMPMALRALLEKL